MLNYLSRYTHRVAIANSRLISLEDGRVSFRWRDYRHSARNKIMTLAAGEFIRRFLLHTLPDGFQRIRHYGFLANGCRAGKLALCRQLLAVPPPEPPPPPPCDFRERLRRLTGRDLDICPCCGGPMVSLGPLPRPPPPGATAFQCDTSMCHFPPTTRSALSDRTSRSATVNLVRPAPQSAKIAILLAPADTRDAHSGARASARYPVLSLSRFASRNAGNDDDSLSPPQRP